MNADEILLIRDIRRMFDKRPIDSQRLDVQTIRGHVTLSGQLKTLRSQPTVDIKEEVADLEKRLRKDPRVRTLTAAFRIVLPEKKEHEQFAEPEKLIQHRPETDDEED